MIKNIAVTVACMSMGLLGQVPLHTIMAQTAPAASTTTVEDLIWRIANSLGAMSILAWYFYRTQTRTIPEKDAQLQAERAAADVKVKATLDATTLEMQHERESHTATVMRLVEELKSEREARMAIIRQCDGKK